MKNNLQFHFQLKQNTSAKKYLVQETWKGPSLTSNLTLMMPEVHTDFGEACSASSG